MTKTHIEEMLLQANPVGDVEQMRLPSSEVEARCASILERRDAMTAPTSTRDETVCVSGSRSRLQPALAFAVGLIVVLVAVGGIVIWAGGGDGAVVDEPATTPAPTTLAPTSVPPTIVDAALDGRIETLAYADVPSFTAMIQYYEHDPATGQSGWQATIGIRHAGPMAFEATVLAESGEFSTLTGADTFFFGDGTDVWVMEGGTLGPFPMPFEPFRHVFFDGEPSASAWDDICGATPTELGVETIAGRTATHVACSTDLETHELWIDEESGLVLRMKGPLSVGDFAPYLARDGLFEFTEIVFEPVEKPAAPEPAQPGSDLALPPLHMIRRDSGEFWTERETWYFDDRTLLETVVDAADPSHIDSFNFAVDGEAGGCSIGEGCEVFEIEDGQTYGLFDQDIPEELVAENCTGSTDGTVAGRPARHYTCDGLTFLSIETSWRVVTDEDAGVSEYWFDAEIGLNVKVTAPTWGWEVTVLEVNPQFPAGIFDVETEYVPPDDAITEGDPAPAWSGPLVGGGTFDLADEAGKYVIVYNWSPYYAVPVVFDYLYEFQLFSDSYATELLTFVSVSEDTLTETQQVLDRVEITVPTVYCGWDPDQMCFPESPWFLWGNSIPSVTVIDPYGVVVGVFAQPPIGEELDQLLADIGS